MFRIRQVSIALAAWFFTANAAPAHGAAMSPIGVAKVDITPSEPIRLSGYGFRREPHEGVIHSIWAKALAIGGDESGPAVLLMVDGTCIPESVTGEVARRLAKSTKVVPDRFALSYTHTHTAPMVRGALDTLFGEPVPEDHQAAIDRYTAALIDKLEQVSLAALNDRRPGTLSWAVGSVDFAANRRTPGGPVDHSVPVMFVRGMQGELRAIIANYACHCTTLDDNSISGDWAGYAQIHIERAHPNAIAMITIGCGADSNPEPRRSHELAEQHGRSVAAEVERLLGAAQTPIAADIAAKRERIQLAFDTLPSREEWEARAELQDAVGYHARVQLARLDAGQKLPTELGYTIQTWTFGNDLGMVFLPGEVVVDYELRLKREFDPSRIWVNAYSNDAPCYVPSRRIWEEGGYEGASAMTYYDRPTRLAPDTEERIFQAVHRLLPESFRSKPEASLDSNREFPVPLSPSESLGALRLKPGFRAEVVACEPLIVDPVAIDFGADGKLWVAEMHDYPSGLDGNWKPGGRLKFLLDRDADGRYDDAVTLADDLPFPTGVMAWKQGALVCAAPDVLYIADADGDAKAEVRETVLTGFVTENYQARVNGLTYGLDNWIYGANGLLGGVIQMGTNVPVALGARDFRFRPDAGALEPVSGLTQQGRIRDDAGNYFGCDNGTLLRHYPLPDHYLSRNPHVAAPPAGVYVPRHAESNRVFSVSPFLDRFNDPEHAGRVTSGCGPGIYRDVLLGAEFNGNAFVCEPVHNLVTRLVLEPDGTTFAGHRAADEQESEFLASVDNWFRPVQVTTGPDGALWVVDMYRFVIEHPRWITPERLAKLDVRAGADRGRIYRVFRDGIPPRNVVPVGRLNQQELIAELGSPNGPRRDLAQREVIRRRIEPQALESVIVDGESPWQRLHALASLDGLDRLSAQATLAAMSDPHATIRRHAARLAEKTGRGGLKAKIVARLIELARDDDAQVRLQAACSLGDFREPTIGAALAELLLTEQDAYISAAAFSSMHPGNLVTLVDALFAKAEDTDQFARIARGVLDTASASGEDEALRRALSQIVKKQESGPEIWRWNALASTFDALDGAGMHIEAMAQGQVVQDLQTMLVAAAACAMDRQRADTERQVALKLLGRRESDREQALRDLVSLLGPSEPPTIQAAALSAIMQLRDDAAAHALLDAWPTLSPGPRNSAMDALLARDAWALILLSRLEQGEISLQELDAARRARLAEHANSEIQAQAMRLLASSPPVDRQAAIQQSLSVALHVGDAARGRQVFEARCASCHAFQGLGHAVGPDLAALSERNTPAFLTALLDPNRAVDARYASYSAVTAAGLTLTGILAGESAADVKLLTQDGRVHVILRNELEQLQASAKSLMPEGLEKEVNVTQLADLFAFLDVASPPPKTAEGLRPSTSIAEGDGVLTLPAAACEVYGPTLQYMPEDDALGYWNSNEDYCVWNIDVPRSGDYQVSMEWSCDAACADNGFAFESSTAQLSGRVPSTTTWQNHQQRTFGTIQLAEGKQRVLFRADGPIQEALLDLRWVKLTPAKAESVK